MPTFPCHGADARCEGGRAGWSSSSGSAHVDINNTKGEVPCSTAPGLLLQLPEALVTTKHAQELCRLIGLILKNPPHRVAFPVWEQQGRGMRRRICLSLPGEEVSWAHTGSGSPGLCCIPSPHPTTAAREGGSSLLCQFFFVIFCFLLVFFLFSFLLFFFLFFIFLFLAAPGHLLLLQNKECKINRGGHGAAPGPTQTTAVKQCWGPVAKRKSCRQKVQAGHWWRPQGPKAFQGDQR